MFKIYHSNDLDVQKDILYELIERDPLADPLKPETILVQSPSMAHWLQLKLAEKKGISANVNFPLPASFIWQQYVDNLPHIAEQNPFRKDAIVWYLMDLLQTPEFQFILDYNEQPEQIQVYQLARNIADLFDQYLVYRPDWITAWEEDEDNEQKIFDDIFARQQSQQSKEAQQEKTHEKFTAQIQKEIAWQGQLWRALVEKIKTQFGEIISAQHRANLHKDYISLKNYKKLPPRIFIFGISALPKTYLDSFIAMSKHCDVHLFFNNPSEGYWGDIVDSKFAQQLSLKKRELYKTAKEITIFSKEQISAEREITLEQEQLLVGHPLLSAWGKLGRDFFYLLSQCDAQEIQANTLLDGKSLLTQIQHKILHLSPSQPNALKWDPSSDNSLSFHACHSPMREVEVLHDYLLRCFQDNPELTPKDIVVMVADIDRYTPYIQAVFGQHQNQKAISHNRYIPFSITDETLSKNDVLLSAFLSLLRLKESQFYAEDVLALLDIPVIQCRFGIDLADCDYLREWVKQADIRFGLHKENGQTEPNYNAWKAGLSRMLLGFAMRENNGLWQQDLVGFDNSYGLKSRLVGILSDFIEKLAQWHQKLQQPRTIEEWGDLLTALLDDFFVTENLTQETQQMIVHIRDGISNFVALLQQIKYTDPIYIDVIADALTERLNEQSQSQKFLVGKVNFCTLLPMRSIPFKVVCLLGMNERDYPRQRTPNRFDLMQYHHQKGDRIRRDDDRYLFLEALLAAQERLYISYVGQSIIDNTKLEPSVLVNQLLDYVDDNLDKHSAREQIIYHAMTAFSPKNFSKNHRSFAQEWAEISQVHQVNQSAIQDFVSPSHSLGQSNQEPRYIDSQQLLKFVQHPVKFFFEKQLDVYLGEENDQIAESENFELDALTLYDIRNKLLQQESENFDKVFAQLKVKGVLPRGEFAQIYADEVRSEITMFQEKLKDYLDDTPKNLAFNLHFEIDGQDVWLQGYLESLFTSKKTPHLQRVAWRVGRHKESYTIENWLYYLIQLVAQGETDSNTDKQEKAPQIAPPIFYAREDKNAVEKTFQAITAKDAKVLLEQYLRDFLASEQAIQLVVTEDIKKYLDKAKVDDEQGCIDVLESLAKDGFRDYEKADVYWRRVLKQTDNLSDYLPTISQKTKSWFEQMLSDNKKEKGEK